MWTNWLGLSTNLGQQYLLTRVQVLFNSQVSHSGFHWVVGVELNSVANLLKSTAGQNESSTFLWYVSDFFSNRSWFNYEIEYMSKKVVNIILYIINLLSNYLIKLTMGPNPIGSKCRDIAEPHCEVPLLPFGHFKRIHSRLINWCRMSKMS